MYQIPYPLFGFFQFERRGRRLGRCWPGALTRRRAYRRHGLTRRWRRLAKRLRLREEQIEGLLRLQQLFGEMHSALRAQRGDLLAAMKPLLLEPETEPTQAMVAVTQTTRTLDEKAAELIMTLREFSAALDIEQRHKLVKLFGRS